MERVWKRVSLAKKHRAAADEQEAGGRRPSCYRVAAATGQNNKPPNKQDKVPRDFMWCDLVTAGASSTSASSPASPPPGADPRPPPALPSRRPNKSGFVLNLDSRLVMELNPKALTRRLCRAGWSRDKKKNKQDNELYRSNSFRFERYERPAPDEDNPDNKVAVCDEYSLPVDFINRRTRSFASGLANWTPSPNGENLQVFEGYSDPRDCKAYLEPGQAASTKVYTSPDADKYSRPHRPPKEFEDLHPSLNFYSEVKEHPASRSAPHRKHHRSKVRQSASLDSPRAVPRVKKSSSNNKASSGGEPWSYDADVESPLSEQKQKANGGRRHRRPVEMPCDVLVRSRSSVCVPCRGGAVDEPDCGAADADNMSTRSGRKQIYETAFDSRVSKSEDELDEVDRVSNHPVLRMFSRAARGLTPRGIRKESKKKHQKQQEKESPDPEEGPSGLPQRPASAIPSRLAAELGALRVSSPPPPAAGSPLRAYTPSPPSTAPLPAKFHAPAPMNSIQSAPDLPTGSPARLKDLRLPVKSLKARNGNRPTSLLIAGVQAAHRGPKYSSTESMATSSSSMSSLDSLRSSTSEGNRSSTSSGSSGAFHNFRRSDSLSSHSSDSGGDLRRVVPNRCAPLGLLSNKLHILSPISDKSQEPGSETSDNNRNNNSQKPSPEEAATAATPTATDDLPWDMPKLRRRMQNKNVINLQFGAPSEVLQGSDSGISIESRHFENLPFDMPKLRRRLAAATGAGSATSSSATSVASSSNKQEELPFDMPKLRRRQLRPASTFEPLSSNSSAFGTTTDSNATVSLYFSDSAGGGAPLRPPSLDLGGPSAFRPVLSSSNRPGGLSLNFGCSALTARGDEVDVSIPLERQGWFHGAITRVEAEAELRLHPEGSYLVRNSESSRQDFSLSLKSARGFMHMRIQQDPDTGQYILGQFSKPFPCIPEMVHYYSVNRLPIRGAEHMCLLRPVIEQLL